MKEEVEAAVEFLVRMVRKGRLGEEKAAEFGQKLTEVLMKKFENHWYQSEPTKGQAYRCIRINEFEPVDAVLDLAARRSGIKFPELGLPQELTLWVDPAEVCCRFGEAKGSFCTVASFRGESRANHASTLDIAELLQRHKDLKSIEMKKILYGHHRQTAKTFAKRPSFSPVFTPSSDDNNVNMSNWAQVSSESWKAKSLNGHLSSNKSKYSWLAAEMIVA